MKNLKIQTFSLFAVVLFSFTLMSVNDTAERKRKFWCTVTSNCTTEYVGGGCYQEYCDYYSYVFWIHTEHLEHIPTGQMDCN